MLLLSSFANLYCAQTKLTETQKLAATCKVWGYLKYYHPNVADGSKNWDEQLFEFYHKLKKHKPKRIFISYWKTGLTSQGEVKGNKATKAESKVEYFNKNFNLSWIRDSKVFSKNLSKKLKFIEENRYQGKQYYVQYDLDRSFCNLKMKLNIQILNGQIKIYVF